MDWDVIYTAMFFTWLIIMLTIFIGINMYDNKPMENAAISCAWPWFAILAIPLLTKNLIFTSTREYRIAIKDRGLMKEFEEFLKLKKEKK